MERELEQLRELAAQPRDNDRYPAELRRQAKRWAIRRRQEGAWWKEIAAEIGVSTSAVIRWTNAADDDNEKRLASVALVPVHVVEPKARAADLAIVSPAGFRIEGLSLEQAVEVLRRLS